MKNIKQRLVEAKPTNEHCEKAKNILKAAVKCLYTINCLPDSSNAKKFTNFYSRVTKTRILIPMLDQIKNE